MLMKGRDLWVFMPDVSQPIRIALSQRLTGQVANGDLARANFAADYNPRLLRTETIGKEDYNVLELIAVDRSVTYQRVIYWVRQKDNWPFKAEFYSLSNRLLKTCKYENYQTMQGRQRPTRLVMEDALRSGEQSVLEYGNMKLRDLPDKIFTKDYLKTVSYTHLDVYKRQDNPYTHVQCGQRSSDGFLLTLSVVSTMEEKTMRIMTIRQQSVKAAAALSALLLILSTCLLYTSRCV